MVLVTFFLFTPHSLFNLSSFFWNYCWAASDVSCIMFAKFSLVQIIYVNVWFKVMKLQINRSFFVTYLTFYLTDFGKRFQWERYWANHDISSFQWERCWLHHDISSFPAFLFISAEDCSSSWKQLYSWFQSYFLILLSRRY